MRQVSVRLILVIFLLVLVLTGGLIFQYLRVSKKNNSKNQAQVTSPSVEESLKSETRKSWDLNTPVSTTIMSIDSAVSTMTLFFSWPPSIPFQNQTRTVTVKCVPEHFRYFYNFNINDPVHPGVHTNGGDVFENAKVGDVLYLYCYDAACKQVGGWCDLLKGERK